MWFAQAGWSLPGTLLIIVGCGIGNQATAAPGGRPAASSPAPVTGASAGSEAREILAGAESLRNPEVTFAAAVTLRSSREGDGELVSTYAMKAGGRDRALIVGTSPERDRGRILLRSGRQYYLHLRTVKNPLRVAPQQGFRGDVANADIARADYLADYEPLLAGEEVIEGKRCHVLELTASANDVAYRRLRYWVEKGTRQPVKTEHYAVSGRILKTVYYEDRRRSLGAVRPHRMRMVDGIDPTQITVIEVTDLREAVFPERIFNPSYLTRLEGWGETGETVPAKERSSQESREDGG